MNIKQLTEELIRDEGCVLHAYQDHLGYWTLGIGRLIDKRKGGGITAEEARYLLENDIGRVVTELRKRVKFWGKLSDARQRALANMGFQLGVAGLMDFRRMLAAMEVMDFRKAADEALNSTWARQTPQRAQRVAKMIREG